MKTIGSAVLFLFLAGLLAARAETLTDENLPGETDKVELTDEDLTNLKSVIKKRTGDLDDDDDVDLYTLRSVKKERELTEALNDADIDLDTLRSAKKARALTGALNDGDADLDRVQSQTEERALKGNTADAGHPVDVARRGITTCRGKCELCVRIFKFNGCIGGRVPFFYTSRGYITVYIKIGSNYVWKKTVTGAVKKHYRITSTNGRLSIYLIHINAVAGQFCVQLRWKWLKLNGRWIYLVHPKKFKCFKVNLWRIWGRRPGDGP